MRRVYIPRDSSAVSVGADDVAREVARLVDDIEIVRTGSRGLLWLEPLVEVDSPTGRIGFGPVAGPIGVGPVTGPIGDGPLTGDINDLATWLRDTTTLHGHPLALGEVDQIDYLQRQQRHTCSRLGVLDPLSLDDYVSHGGYAGLTAALATKPADVCATVTDSGLRGRGGAGFPTGRKWRTVLDAGTGQKFICANADEGDSGTFVDRMLMEGDPFSLIEGMTIAAYAVGATKGYVYIRSEYPDAVRTVRRAVATAEANGYLGEDIQGSGLSFDVEIRVGAGAYICGEETAMLESLEGKRGVVRAKPPIPALVGLFGRPTVVNNVLTLCAVPAILARGAASYAEMGTGRSRGTQVFQLAGNVARGGLVEVPFGITLGELVEGFGGGTRSGRPVRAVQVGGPLGAYLPTTSFGLPMDYEAFAEADAMIGHGGVVVFDDSVDLAEQAEFAMEFCAEESCGKCTPCRIGSVRGVETIARIRRGVDRTHNLLLLDSLCATMAKGSLCAMGGLTPMPVQSAIRHFPEDFDDTTAAARRDRP